MWKKGFNAMIAAEREDYLHMVEFASPSFLEVTLKAYRTIEQDATTPRGKVLTDEQGKLIRLLGGEAATQAMGFRPERLASVSQEHRSMTNVQTNFNERRDDLYSRYLLAKPRKKGRESFGICSGSTWK